MAEKIRTAYGMLGTTRDLLITLADELLAMQSQVFHEAVPLYLAAVSSGEADRPERALGSGDRVSTTLYPTHALRDLLSRTADDWRITQGNILRASLEHYPAALEAGRVPKPRPTRKPKTETVKKDERPKRKADPAIVRPIAKPVFTDRAQCPECHASSAWTRTRSSPSTSLIPACGNTESTSYAQAGD